MICQQLFKNNLVRCFAQKPPWRGSWEGSLNHQDNQAKQSARELPYILYQAGNICSICAEDRGKAVNIRGY